MPQPAIDFHPEAIAEARHARIWYAERSPDAARRFLAELDRAVEQISRAADRWPAYLHQTRHYLLRGFPYAVVYRTVGETIQVVAVAHARRKPGYWQSRLDA